MIESLQCTTHVLPTISHQCCPDRKKSGRVDCSSQPALQSKLPPMVQPIDPLAQSSEPIFIANLQI